MKREWASIRGIGLPTALGEFYGLPVDQENLIRVINRLARKLADDHPDLTLCFSGVLFTQQQWFQDRRILASSISIWCGQ